MRSDGRVILYVQRSSSVSDVENSRVESDNYYFCWDLFHDIRSGDLRNGHLYCRIPSSTCTVYVYVDVHLPEDCVSDIVLVSGVRNGDSVFFEGFYYADLCAVDMSDLARAPYKVPELSRRIAPPLDTPSLYQGGLQTYETNTFFNKNFVVLIDVSTLLLLFLLFVRYSYLIILVGGCF